MKEGVAGLTGKPIESMSASVIVGASGSATTGNEIPAASTASVSVLLTVIVIVGAVGGTNAVAPDLVMSKSTVGAPGNTIALRSGAADMERTGGEYTGAVPKSSTEPSSITGDSIDGADAETVKDDMDKSDPRLSDGNTIPFGAV